MIDCGLEQRTNYVDTLKTEAKKKRDTDRQVSARRYARVTMMTYCWCSTGGVVDANAAMSIQHTHVPKSMITFHVVGAVARTPQPAH